MKITVAGSGAFGTALAIALSGAGDVTLLGRDAGEMADVARTRQHQSRLPGAELPEAVKVTATSDVLGAAQIVLLCMPMQHLGGYLRQNKDRLGGKALIACCKGIALDSLQGAAELIAEQVPDALAGVLTGPSFAVDIARGLPTALTLAVADDGRGEVLQQALTRKNLRLYRTTDVIGAQLGGALKNVIAIAAGVCIGARLGESARAALITRGFAEMQVLATGMGARPDTLMGLSGLGDLILTCSSEQSRNFRFGLSIGRCETFDAAVTVEGAATAQAVMRIAAREGLDLPVTQAVNNLISGDTDVETALQGLLSRPLRHE